MKQEQEPVKRIISKGGYARYVVNRCWFYLKGWSFGAMIAVAVHCAVSLLFPPHKIDLRGSLLWAFWFTPVMMFCAAYCHWIQGKPQLGPQLHNSLATDLPEPDSLVRASHKPAEAQKTVLLRAAAQGSETLIEQLLRPAEVQG